MLGMATRRDVPRPTRRVGALCAAVTVVLPSLLTPPAAATPGAPWNRGPARLTFGVDASGARINGEGGAPIGLAVTAIGRGDGGEALGKAAFEAGGCPGAVADLARTRGAVCEWWRVAGRAAEHGAVIGARPSGSGALWLAVGVRDAEALVSEDGRVAVLHAGARARLRYAHARAWDAAERPLPVRLEAAPGGLRLVVDDRGAAYPIHIDPTVSATSIEPDKAWAEFGTSVAGGDFDGDGQADVVVGAPYFMANVFGTAAEGKAYVWKGRDGSLGPYPQWNRSGPQVDARFAVVVASAGDVDGDGDDEVLVGAPFLDGAYAASGRIFLYGGGAGGPSLDPVWTADGEHANALLGACAGAGDVDGDGYDDVVVGAPNFDSDVAHVGRVRVYRGGPGGLATSPSWSFSGAKQSAYGFAVGPAGDVNGDGYADIIVGAYSDDTQATDGGRAFVYHGSASGPASVADWQVGGSQSGALFGAWVAGAGDVDGDGYDDVVVAAPNHDGAAANAGRVVVYRGSADGLLDTPSWSYTGQLEGEWLGTMADGAGDVNRDGYHDLLVGAYRYSGAETDEGRVLLFYGGSAGLAAEPAWAAASGQAGANLGIAVAGLGDLDADGFPDLAAGARLYTSGEMDVDEGRVFLWRGCADADLDGGCDPAQPDPDLAEPGPEPSAEPGPEPSAEPGPEPSVEPGPESTADAGTPTDVTPDAGAPGDTTGADTAVAADVAVDDTATAVDASTDSGLPDAVSSDTLTADTLTTPDTVASGDGCECRSGGGRGEVPVGGLLVALAAGMWRVHRRRRLA